MHCPFCSYPDTKVIDSRLVAVGDQIRRRRECGHCNERFTTYETAELLMPKVVKQNGIRESFDDAKLQSGIRRALEKRPVSSENINAAIIRIKKFLRANVDPEVASSIIGEQVMKELRQLDQVAYVRFASVYRRFQDLDEFRSEIESLTDGECSDAN